MLTIRIVDADGVSGSGIVVSHFKNDWDAWDDENNRLVDAEWFASFLSSTTCLRIYPQKNDRLNCNKRSNSSPMKFKYFTTDLVIFTRDLFW